MVETIRCASCGSNNTVEARFCSDCGVALMSATTGPTRRLDGKVCPNCDTYNPENVQFCSGCGQELRNEPALRAQPNPPMHARQPQRGESMYCPVCRDVTLIMADRQGIEVDYCPNCRGVWLDRGELDKIIERVALAQGGSTGYPTQPRSHSSTEYRDQRDDDDYRRTKKRRGLLDELFDFD